MPDTTGEQIDVAVESLIENEAFIDAYVESNDQTDVTTPDGTTIPSLQKRDRELAESGHVGRTDNPHAVTKTQVGLSEVDNTSDTEKPVSEATQAELDSKADAATVGASLAAKADTDLTNADNASVTLALLASEVTALLGTGFDPSLAQGDWVPATDTPVIPLAGTAGRWYRVSAAGTASGTNADGVYNEDDIVVDNGTTWELFRFPTANIPNNYVTFAMIAASVQKLIGETLDITGWISAVRDTNNALLMGIKDNGDVFIHSLDSPTIDTINARIDQRETDTAPAEALADQINPAGDVLDALEVIKDSNGVVAAYIRKSNGAFYIHKLESPDLAAIETTIAQIQSNVSSNDSDIVSLDTRTTQLENDVANFSEPTPNVLKAFINSDNNIVRVNADDSETPITADSTPANPDNLKKELKAGVSSLSFLEDKRQHRIGLNGKGKRRVFAPADVNHILVHGQSNSTGFNPSQGAPVNTTQPFDNLMFTPVTLRLHESSGPPISQTDDSTLTYVDVAGSGLRGPWTSVLTITLQDNTVVYWGPGGKNTMHHDHDFFATQLATATFQPLVEAYEPVNSPAHSESIVSSICNELTTKTGHRFLGSTAGIGGMPLEFLSATNKGLGSSADNAPFRNTVDLSAFSPALNGWWGSGGFANVLTQVKRAKEICDSKGWTYKVAAMPWIQGETDNGNLDYATEIAELAEAVNTCVKAITGQQEDIVLFVDGITYNGEWGGKTGWLPVDQETLIAHENTDTTDNLGRIYLTGPRYQYRTSTHYDAQSFVSKGTVFAEAINQVVFNSEEWESLRYKSHVVDGNDIYIRFHTPQEPLQFDVPLANSVSQTVTGAEANHGFKVLDSGQTNILTGVSLEYGDMIKLSCSSSPTGGQILYSDDVGTGTLIRGDVCDSFVKPTVAKDGGNANFETRNFLHPFTTNV